MTRKQAIDRWDIIIRTVFQAEHNLQDELQELVNHKADLGTQKTVDEYVRLIAEEIVSHTTDEELDNWKE